MRRMKIGVLACTLFLVALVTASDTGSTGGDPQLLWYYDLDAPSFGSAAAGDIDGDGYLEIVFGTYFNDEFVYALNAEDGSISWQTNLGTDSYIQSGPNILDVDGDGQLDVVVAQWAGDCRVYALKGDDASVLWYSDIPGDYMYHGGSFADIDEDGKPEIAIGCYDNYVYLLNAEDGSLEWDYLALCFFTCKKR